MDLAEALHAALHSGSPCDHFSGNPSVCPSLLLAMRVEPHLIDDFKRQLKLTALMPFHREAERLRRHLASEHLLVHSGGLADVSDAHAYLHSGASGKLPSHSFSSCAWDPDVVDRIRRTTP